ncbi:MAG: hypothetical protein R3F24_12330 [Gammaproteobacteria bacterium]
MLEKAPGVARRAACHDYESKTARKQLARQGTLDTGAQSNSQVLESTAAEAVNGTSGKVVLYTMLWQPEPAGDGGRPRRRVPATTASRCNWLNLSAVLRHAETGARRSDSVAGSEIGKRASTLARWVADGWDIVAPVPSCVLMFKQELPLMFPDDEQVQAVGQAFFDPFNYLYLRHQGGKLRTNFATSLGKVSYHVPCHLRVQNIGLKTRDVLQLIPDTTVHPIERCSGHDGTYGVKTEFRAASVKIAQPVATQVENSGADEFCSDCPMAAAQIADLAKRASHSHPMQLLRRAYGI